MTIKNALPLVFIAILVVALGWLAVGNNNLKHEYNNLSVEYSVLEKKNASLKQAELLAIDSANYYKVKADGVLVVVDSLKTELADAKQKLNDIPAIVADVTPLEAYDSLQAILSPPTDSLELCFAGNQTKELYEDELELKAITEVLVVCETTVDSQNDLISAIGLENYHKGIALDSCQLRADNAETMAQSAVNVAEETNKKLRKWKIGSIGGGAGLLLLLVLL